MLIADLNKQASLSLKLGYNACPLCNKRKLKLGEARFKCFYPYCVANPGGDLIDLLSLLGHGSRKQIVHILDPGRGRQYYQDLETIQRSFDAYVVAGEENGIINTLEGRGYSAVLESTPIGYAPSGQYLQRQGLPLTSLIRVGLVKPSGAELYQERIIFPIYNGGGQLVHLQGRAIDPNEELRWLATPKRDNSASINSFLFGTNAIEQGDTLFLAEGVSDALSFIELGVTAIACFGLEPKLLAYKQLSKVSTLVCCFDSDRFDTGALEGQYKSWGRLLIHLLALQSAYPKLSIRCLPPNKKGVKDINDWLLQGLNKTELINEGIAAQALAQFAMTEFDTALTKQRDLIKSLGGYREGRLLLSQRLNNERCAADPLSYLYELLSL